MSNSIITETGTGGGVSVYNRFGTVDLIVDVQGYYTTGTTSGTSFEPLTPQRIYDTRTGVGGSSTPIGDSETRLVQVTGRGGVPSTGVSAVVVNVTVTNVTASTFLTTWGGGPRPAATTLNAPAGGTVGAMVTSKLDSSGRVSIYNHNGTADLIVDVEGYYLTTRQDGSSYFVPVTPTRVFSTVTGLNTPQGALSGGSVASVPIRGVKNGSTLVVPDEQSVSAVVLSVTAANPQPSGAMSAYPDGTAYPGTSVLNYPAGTTTTGTVVAKIGSNGRVAVRPTSGPVDLIVDVQGYFQIPFDDPAPEAADAGDRKFFTYTSEQLTDRLVAKVNVGNGNLLLGADDLRAAGVAGLDLGLRRSYNSVLAGSSGTDKSRLGPGWSHNLGGSVRLEFPRDADSTVLFHGPSGYRVRFEKNSAGGYTRHEPGLDGNLRFHSASNTLRVEMHGKQVYAFKPFAAGDPASGRLTEMRDKQGNTITFSYNADQTLAQAVDTRGRVAVFSYRPGDGMLGSVELRTPTGSPLIRYAYTYTATTPARLASSRVEFLAASLGSDTTNTGVPTTYTYDAAGRLNQVKDARENAGPQPVGGTTSIAYYGDGKVQSLTRHTDDTTLPDSVSSYTYATDTGTVTKCNGEGTSRTVVDGERTDVTDTTTYCADTHGRVVRVIDAKDHVRKNTYTANSNVATFDGSGLSSGGSSFSFSYDTKDNPTNVTTPTGGQASAQYADPANAHFPTSMRDFDTGGSTSAPATWAYDYDDNGNLIESKAAVTTGKNITYRYCWDGDGQLQRIDPIDAAGNQSTALDTDLNAGCGTASQGNDTLHSYDSDGHLTTVDPPGPHRTQTYTYDALSRVKTVTDGRGVFITYTYDALDHVVAETFDPAGAPELSGQPTATVTWSYDAAGNLLQMTDPTGPTTFGYDELNRRVTQSQEAPSNTKTYRYDPADNLREAEVSDEPEPTKYTYDAVNLVTSVDDQRTGANVVSFDYDRHDKRTKTTFPMPGGNHVIQRAAYGDGGQMQCVYSYRANTVPAGAGNDTCPAATAAGLLSFTSYSYVKPGTGLDTNTRYKATEKGGVTTDYTYDPISRLTAATAKAGDTTTLRSFTYDYDRHSNLVKDVTAGSTPGLQTGTTTLAYNDAEELCWTLTGTSTNGCGSAPAGATTYTHDGAGALNTASNGLNLDYNAIGQTSSIDPAGATGPLPMTYAGVTQDRRLSKDTLEMSYGFSGLSSQSTNSGVPHAEWFVRDPDGKLIAQIDRNARDPDRYYLMDGQDSIVGTIDTNGQVRRYLYEPYGQQIRTWIDTNPTNNSTGTSAPPDGSHNPPVTGDNAEDLNPWRYASGYHDTETGMLKYGTRYYDPRLDRWTQVDPKAGKPQRPLSLNPYLYGGDNPTNRTDSSGRDWDDNTVDEAFERWGDEAACVGATALIGAIWITDVGTSILGIATKTLFTPQGAFIWFLQTIVVGVVTYELSTVRDEQC